MEEKQEEYRVDMFCLQLAAIVKRILADGDKAQASETRSTNSD